ncbi:response regulator [Frigidibacter sp. MR17.24]|uniref:response regulator n=1 Tax=Frigidibacter sp. MR17.24 TaxID=3127345 RepID=UPI003012DCB8
MRILLVEDDYILATGLSAELARLGARIIGPFRRDGDAMAAADEAGGAILDIQLVRGTSFALAERLMARRVPLLFYSGTDRALPIRFSDVPRFSKPTGARCLLTELERQGARRPLSAPSGPMAALPLLRAEARRLLADGAAADRLVEATLERAIRLAADRDRSEPVAVWLARLLRSEHRRRGSGLLN